MYTRKAILFLIFILIVLVGNTQTVIDFVRMVDAQFQSYQDGEHVANDSIIDISNGYYQRGFKLGNVAHDNPVKILRQMAIFSNDDDTKTIVEAISYWNFVCWTNELRFYHYDGELLNFVENKAQFIPSITINDFLSENSLSIFKKYYQNVSHDQYPSLEIFIAEAYDDFRFVLPQYGTDIMVHLDYCDQFGEGLEISEEEMNTLRIGGEPLKLLYDKVLKQFVK